MTASSGAPFRLPVLEARRGALEKCVYCPKLCRASCPVSNAEPSESLTPWGKMSAAFFLARGDLSLAKETTDLAWACTGCLGCRERCDHKNPVADTLADARAGLFEAGSVPDVVRALSSEREERRAERRVVVERLGHGRAASLKLLLGCGYLRYAHAEAELAVAVLAKLLGREVHVLSGCCGYTARAAGDALALAEDRADLSLELDGADRLVVLDPGCARAMLEAEGRFRPTPEPFIDLLSEHLAELAPRADERRYRYHDACQLGRGLGRYEQPRALVARVSGRAPHEFERARERADCAGGGGLLPLTNPEVSSAIADGRIAEHDRLGGGTIVTGCAGSLHRFRKSGADAIDLVTLAARGLGLTP